jgi:hypothetical protein
MGAEFPGLRLEDHGSDNVGGEEIRCELDPLKLDAKCGGQRLDQQCLGQAGHALKEDVPAREKGHEEPLDSGILADDGLADFIAEFL